MIGQTQRAFDKDCVRNFCMVLALWGALHFIFDTNSSVIMLPQTTLMHRFGDLLTILIVVLCDEPWGWSKVRMSLAPLLLKGMLNVMCENNETLCKCTNNYKFWNCFFSLPLFGTWSVCLVHLKFSKVGSFFLKWKLGMSHLIVRMCSVLQWNSDVLLLFVCPSNKSWIEHTHKMLRWCHH